MYTVVYKANKKTLGLTTVCFSLPTLTTFTRCRWISQRNIVFRFCTDFISCVNLSMYSSMSEGDREALETLTGHLKQFCVTADKLQ